MDSRRGGRAHTNIAYKDGERGRARAGPGAGVPLGSREDTNFKEQYQQMRGLFGKQASVGDQVGSSSRPSPKPKAVVPIYDKESRDKEAMYSPAIKGVRACVDALANLQGECKSAERETKTHSYDRPLQQTLARYQDNDDWIINLKQMTLDHPNADGDVEDIMEQLQTSLNLTRRQSISILKNKWTWYRKHTTEENLGKIREFAFDQLGVIAGHLGTLVTKDPDTASTEQVVKHESETKDHELSLPSKTPPTLSEKPSHLRPSSSRSESSGDVKPPRAQGASSFKPDPPAPRHTLFHTEEIKATNMELEERSNELDTVKKAGNSTEEELKQIKLDFEAKSKELDDEKQKYSEREEELKATKLELEARSNELDKLNNEMVNKSAEEEQTKRDLEAKSNEPDEDNVEMVQKYSELEKRLKQTEDNLKAKDIELVVLRNEAAEKTGQLAHARSDEEAKSAKVNELYESKKDVGQEIAKLREQLTTAQYEATARTNKVEALLEERSKWTADIVSYDSQLKQAHADKDRKSTKISEFEHEIVTLKNQLELKKADVTTKSSSISELQRDKDKLDNKITLLENQLKEKEADMKFKADVLMEMYNEKVTRESVNATLQVKHKLETNCLREEKSKAETDLADQKEKHKQETKRLREEKSKAETDVAVEKEKLEDAKMSSDQLLTNHTMEVAKLKREKSTVELQLAEEKGKREAKDDAYDKLLTQHNIEMARVNRENSAVQSELAANKEQLNMTQEALRQKTKELGLAQQAPKQAEEDIKDYYEVELNKKEVDNQDLRRQLKDLQDEQSSLADSVAEQKDKLHKEKECSQQAIMEWKSIKRENEETIQKYLVQLHAAQDEARIATEEVQTYTSGEVQKKLDKVTTDMNFYKSELQKIDEERKEAERKRNEVLVVSCLLLNETGMAANFKTARDDFMRRVATRLKEQKKSLQIFEIPPSGELPVSAANMHTPCVLIMPCLAVSRVTTSIDSLMAKPAAKAGHTLLCVVFHPRAPHDRTVAPSTQQIGSLPTSCEKLVDVVFNRSNGGIFDGGPNDTAASDIANYMRMRPAEETLS